MSNKHFSRDELERRREKLKDDRYRCFRCGGVETPILVGDAGDGAEYGEPDDKVLGYACENPECISDIVRPYLEERSLEVSLRDDAHKSARAVDDQRSPVPGLHEVPLQVRQRQVRAHHPVLLQRGHGLRHTDRR